MRVETLMIRNFSSDGNERIINKQKAAKPPARQGHDWHLKVHSAGRSNLNVQSPRTAFYCCVSWQHLDGDQGGV